MKYLSLSLIFVFFIIIPNTAFCGHKIGYTPKVCLFTIDDPDGDTETYTGVQGLGLTYIYDLNRKSRLYTDFTMIDFETDGSTSDIANTVKGYTATTAYQHIFRVTRKINFYLGAGITMSQLYFDDRYTTTPSGFLANSYDDRTETSFAGYINISNEWEINEKFGFGLNAAYQHDFADSISGLSVNAAIFYKFGQ